MHKENENKIPESGYIVSLSIYNIPILIHWSFPVGGLLAAFWLGNQTLSSFLALITAYTTLIIVHEFGHAIAAKIYSTKVICILVTGLGGWCFVTEKPKEFAHQMLFYGGGILAQFILLIVTILLICVFGSPESAIIKSFAFIFTFANVLLIICNLIPEKNNDGTRLFAALKDNINT